MASPFCAVFVALGCLFAAGAAHAYTPNLATVPWLGNPNIPHQVYSGGPLVLQGVATDLDTGSPLCISSATWDSGAGPSYNAGTNGYALEATHTYFGAVNQPFTATLTVTLCDTTVLTDTMRVVIRPDSRETRVNMAIDKGLWYLHKRINRATSDGLPSGYWRGYSSYYMTATAGVVQAFEINNHRESGDITEDPYVDDVARGMRYILSQQHGKLQTTPVPLEAPGHDPDGNGNGYGLGVNWGRHASYLGGQLIDAIVASGTPGKLAETGPVGSVRGRRYDDIVQDLLDGYSYGMHEPTGGWWYSYPNFGGAWNNNDTSASHWWAIGVLAAEVWGLDAPDWVKNVQWTVGVPRMQRWAPPSGCYFGYTGSWGSRWGDNQTNVTSAGLILMNADDIPQTDPRYTCAMGWLDTYFNASLGNFYTMYQLAKAMRTALDDTGASAPITLLNGTRDWYAAYADWIVSNQNPVTGQIRSREGSGAAIGRWVNGFGNYDMATSWGLIMLSPSLFELPPQAVCNASPLIDGTAEIGGNVNFDGSQSSHPDPERTIVSYSWEFDDGSPGAVGETTSHSFANVGIYNVVLTVEDDKGNTDTDICQIDVRDNDIPPASRPGGPYQICLGEDLELDGSASSDLDNEIVLYEWDWNSPIDFTSVDSTDISPTVPGATFPATGIYDVGLRVTDNDGSNGGTDHTSSAFTTVTVVPADDPSCNQPPVAVCEARVVSADDQCQGTASIDAGSFDPDGVDDIASIVENPGSPYSLGETLASLTITDLSGEFDSCEATVTVVDDTRPTLSCPAAVTLECPADTSPANTGSATATDACDPNVAIEFSDSAVPNCGQTETITRTWTATDAAGNVETCQQLITVVDTAAPTIDAPGDETLQCGVDTYVEPNAIATDACDPNVQATTTGSADDGIVGAYVITYDAVDACGNPSQVSRTVTVVDTLAPTFDCPLAIDVVAEAGCQAAIPEFEVVASDACTTPVVTQTLPDGTPSVGQIVGLGTHDVVITATDAQGNSSSCTTTVRVYDPDEDGVCGTDDVCADTVLPDGVPTGKHGVNRWALEPAGDPYDEDPFTFDTVGPNGSNRAYTTTDTGGCSCEQIIEQCGYGKGHTKFGCSNSVMDWWTGLFDQAGQPEYQCH